VGADVHCELAGGEYLVEVGVEDDVFEATGHEAVPVCGITECIANHDCDVAIVVDGAPAVVVVLLDFVEVQDTAPVSFCAGCEGEEMRTGPELMGCQHIIIRLGTGNLRSLTSSIAVTTLFHCGFAYFLARSLMTLTVCATLPPVCQLIWSL